MADLRDGLLRAIAARIDSGYGMSLVMAGEPWQCCPGAKDNGPGACTCWIPVYNRNQAEPALEIVVALALGEIEPDVQPRMCGDCAYRPGSPEKTGDSDVHGDAALLEHLADTGQRFYCHDGMRSPRAWRHPAGIEIPAVGTGDYQPPIIDGIPYRADGRPGLLCAGWAARHRALTARPTEPSTRSTSEQISKRSLLDTVTRRPLPSSDPESNGRRSLMP